MKWKASDKHAASCLQFQYLEGRAREALGAGGQLGIYYEFQASLDGRVSCVPHK